MQKRVIFMENPENLDRYAHPENGIRCRTNSRRWNRHICLWYNMPIDNRRNCQEERERDADATRSKRRHIALENREHKTPALDVSRAGRHLSIRQDVADV